MDYTVNKTPQECLAAAEMYFMRQWPYQGHVTKTDTRTSFMENQGCLAMFFGGPARGVNVFALPENGGSKLTIDAGRKHYAKTIDGWARDELGATSL